MKFNDWSAQLLRLVLPESQKVLEVERDPKITNIWLPGVPSHQTVQLTLTHGDLYRGNIMIAPAGPPRALAVMDWACGGWHPEWWEYCKACFTSDCEGIGGINGS